VAATASTAAAAAPSVSGADDAGDKALFGWHDETAAESPALCASWMPAESTGEEQEVQGKLPCGPHDEVAALYAAAPSFHQQVKAEWTVAHRPQASA
jgi:hypothetical protein